MKRSGPQPLPFPLPDIYDDNDPRLVSDALGAVRYYRIAYFMPELGCNKSQLNAAMEVALDVRLAWANEGLELREVPLAQNPNCPTKEDFIRLEQWFSDAFAAIAKEIAQGSERGRTQSPTGTAAKEQPWVDDAPEYLPLSEVRKLIDNRRSLSALSKLCKPAGEMKYMRRPGNRCKVHVADFRRYMQSRQSDTTFATVLAAYFSAAGKGDVRFFWHCPQCGADRPENASASVSCPKCKLECKLIRKAPPKPRR